MRSSFQTLALILALGIFLPAGSLHACPLCKDAISSPDEGEGQEINHLPAAYNASIYMLSGMPFVLLGSVGFFIYRGCQRNAEHLGRCGQFVPEQPGPAERIGEFVSPE